MNKKLIATDFDGTLNRNGGVSQEDRESIKRWRDAGNYFGIVTGRGSDFWKNLKKINLEVDYIIVYNGCLIMTPEGKTLYEWLMPEFSFDKLKSYFEKIPDCTYYSENYEEESGHHYYATFENRPDRALEAAAEINEMYGDEVTAFVNYHHVNIGIKGTSKAIGVTKILEHYNLEPDQAATVGDDWNDLDMIISHDGWMVDSARDELKQKAPHICRSVGELADELMEK